MVFHLEEVAEPEPPESTLADLGVDLADGRIGSSADGPVSIVMDETVRHNFLAAAPFSTEIEEGGFLTGQVFRDRNRAGCFIIEISGVVAAERSVASVIDFTFTGESFLDIGAKIATSSPQERLLGWYHTHLFAATDAFGLSATDVMLHRTTFRRPWQVAALVNVTKAARVLRFYRAHRGTMTLAPCWEVGR
jgi:hypothetical protein